MSTFDARKDPDVRRQIEGNDRQKIVQEGGKWFMRVSPRGPRAEIPPQVAQVAQLGLRISRKYPPNIFGEVANIWNRINCHRTAFYALGLINRDDPEDGTPSFPHYGYSFFPPEDFQHFSSFDTLNKFLIEKIGDELGLVQVVGYRDTDGKTRLKESGVSPRLAHSFIAKTDEEGNLVCLEENEFDPSINIVPLEKIFKRGYGPLGYWNAGKVTELANSDAAKFMRDDLNKAKSLETIRSQSPESQ